MGWSWSDVGAAAAASLVTLLMRSGYRVKNMGQVVVVKDDGYHLTYWLH